MSNTHTPLFSYFPADFSPPKAPLSFEPSFFAEMTLYELPWFLEDLTGTKWAAVSQGTLLIIDTVALNRIQKNSAFGIDESQSYRELGIWIDGQYCIRDHVRIDLLPHDSQLQWLLKGVTTLQQALHERNHHRDSEVRHAAAKFEVALHALRTFAQQHQLTLPIDYALQLTFAPHLVVPKPAPDESTVRFKVDELAQIDNATLLHALESSQGILFYLECPNLGSFRLPQESILDHARALLFGETLYPFCHSIVATMHMGAVDFFCRIRDPEEAFNKLRWLLPYVADEDKEDDLEGDDIDEVERRAEVWDFAEELAEHGFTHFLELGDSYLGLISADSDEDPDTMQEMYLRHPEREFDYWRSFMTHDIGFDVYVSRHSWMIPHGHDLDRLLAIYGGFDGKVPTVHASHICTIDGMEPMLINRYGAFYYPDDVLREAKECAEQILRRQEDKSSFFNNEQQVHFTVTHTNRLLKCLIAPLGDLLVASDNLASYIVFQDYLRPVTPSVLNYVADDLAQMLHPLNSISCPWSTLDDEQFEQLCIDILSLFHHVAPDQIRKIGVSRSRDGGRDIEFFHPAQPGTHPKKWIVQCKLLKPATKTPEKIPSLGKSRLLDIGDIIDQNEAEGYVVMTSATIDDTLYNALDAITTKHNIILRIWSCERIERFLDENPRLRLRYFPRFSPLNA